MTAWYTPLSTASVKRRDHPPVIWPSAISPICLTVSAHRPLVTAPGTLLTNTSRAPDSLNAGGHVVALTL